MTSAYARSLLGTEAGNAVEPVAAKAAQTLSNAKPVKVSYEVTTDGRDDRERNRRSTPVTCQGTESCPHLRATCDASLTEDPNGSPPFLPAQLLAFNSIHADRVAPRPCPQPTMWPSILVGVLIWPPSRSTGSTRHTVSPNPRHGNNNKADKQDRRGRSTLLSRSIQRS